MAFILSCYYLDEPLDEQELQLVRQTLLGPWARFKTGAMALAQKRVPAVLPAPDTNGIYSESREQRARRIRPHLRRAGMQADNGHQVVWVMPCDTDWDAIFQFAIRHETGFAPFVVQRWFMEDGSLIRKQARIVDTHMLMREL